MSQQTDSLLAKLLSLGFDFEVASTAVSLFPGDETEAIQFCVDSNESKSNTAPRQTMNDRYFEILQSRGLGIEVPQYSIIGGGFDSQALVTTVVARWHS